MSLIVPSSNFNDNENPDDSFGCMNMSLDELKENSLLINDLLEDLKKENKKVKKCKDLSQREE